MVIASRATLPDPCGVTYLKRDSPSRSRASATALSALCFLSVSFQVQEQRAQGMGQAWGRHRAGTGHNGVRHGGPAHAQLSRLTMRAWRSMGQPGHGAGKAWGRLQELPCAQEKMMVPQSRLGAQSWQGALEGVQEAQSHGHWREPWGRAREGGLEPPQTQS